MIQKDQAALLSQFLNTLPVGICVTGEDGVISIWNHTLETWTGIQKESVLGLLLTEVVPLSADPGFMDRMNVVFAGGGPAILSSRFHPRIFPLKEEAQNEGVVQRITISPFAFPDGKISAILAIEDVTAVTGQVLRYREIKDQIQRELEEKKKTEQALAIAISKLGTLASITRHDLTNSLTAFEGYLTFSLDEHPDEKVAGYLTKMKQVARVMKSHIAFARDYQEMGNSIPTWFSIEDMIRKNVVGPTFSNVSFPIETSTLEVLADPLIVKAIYNLLENAVRHGEHTTVITTRSIKVDEGLILIIEDNGKGVPTQIKSRIFERGFGSNTGLGLFLTREILGITGMQIIETGIEGKGARFEIRIPAGHFRYADTT